MLCTTSQIYSATSGISLSSVTNSKQQTFIIEVYEVLTVRDNKSFSNMRRIGKASQYQYC